MVDRGTTVQADKLNFGPEHDGVCLGATPVSPGLPGRYGHFTTPLGVFDHSMTNLNFRAEGTKNKLGFRGSPDAPRVDVDMDGVIADFGAECMPRGLTPDQFKHVAGAYRSLRRWRAQEKPSPR